MINYYFLYIILFQDFSDQMIADTFSRIQNLTTNKLSFILFSLLLIQIVNSSIILTESSEPADVDLDMTFEEYATKFNKAHTTHEEKEFRKKVFEANLIELEQIMKICHVCGINKYTDWTSDEKKTLRGYIPSTDLVKQRPNIKGASLSTTPIQLPKTFDWREYRVITSVKEQQCGNCWAYTTAAFFESEFIRRGLASNTLDLSEHYFMQCDTQSYGCDGGSIESAVDIGVKHGIPFQKEYPVNMSSNYSGICGAATTMKLPITRRVSKIEISDNEIIQLLLQRPLAIGVDSTIWENYAPSSDKRTLECTNQVSHPSQLDHAALLVGYTESEWIVKNSWGTDFGVNGYFYVSRDSKKDCGIGIEVHSIDFKLPEVNIQVPATPVVPTVIINEAVSCTIANCIQCSEAGDSCDQCQSDYELGEQGECKQLSQDPEPVETFDYYPEIEQVTNVCTDQNCASCQTNDEEETCQWCKKSYGVNEVTGYCETSPIDGCNYFEKKRKLTVCYQCHEGYELQGFNTCTYYGDSQDEFDNQEQEQTQQKDDTTIDNQEDHEDHEEENNDDNHENNEQLNEDQQD